MHFRITKIWQESIVSFDLSKNNKSISKTYIRTDFYYSLSNCKLTLHCECGPLETE